MINMWTYKCKAGVYTETSMIKLLWVIHCHRMHHLINHGRYAD